MIAKYVFVRNIIQSFIRPVNFDHNRVNFVSRVKVLQF